MTYFGRRIVVDVAGLTISEPRINVLVERQSDSTQTNGHVDIYNLSDGHAQLIYDRGTTITVQAGYPTTLATIYQGAVQRVIKGRQQLAHITSIKLGDLVKQGGSVNRLGGVTSRSYDGPVLARQIVTDLVSDIGLEAGPLDAIPADATIENFAFTGPADAALNVALQKVGVKYFSDGSVIRFRPLGTAGRMAQPDAPSVSISPATGLVGVPAVTDDGETGGVSFIFEPSNSNGQPDHNHVRKCKRALRRIFFIAQRR